MKRAVLITGDTGNVGKACMEYASANDWNAIGLSRQTTGIDLSDWDSVVDWVSHQLLDFDLVIMAHGAQRPTAFHFMEQDDWRYVIENNLTASVALTAALVNQRILHENSLIVYFSSIQATQPRIGRAAYAAAKAGIEGLARAAAVELWNEFQARAVALRLGQMTTPMKGIKFPNVELEKIKSRIPGKWVTPQDVARFCFQLHEQPSLNGEVIEISSGHAFNIW